MTDKDKVKTVEIPEGFEMVSDGDLTETHDFDKEPAVMGKIINMKTVALKRGGGVDNNRMMTVQTPDGNTAIWESAGLKDLFDSVVTGDTIYIRFDGLEELDGGRQPMKRFITGMQKTGLRSVDNEA